jgi:hypothetical protein
LHEFLARPANEQKFANVCDDSHNNKRLPSPEEWHHKIDQETNGLLFLL